MASTRERIVRGAVTLFVQQGVARTTTREIAAQSQVAEGSIYRYFPSKEELAWQLFRDYHSHLATTLQKAAEQQVPIKEKITRLVSSFVQLADEDWLMFQYYLSAQHSHMHKIDPNTLTPYGVIVDVIRQATARGDIRQQDPQLLAAMAMGAVHQVAINKQFGRIDGTLSMHANEIAGAVCRIILPEDNS